MYLCNPNRTGGSVSHAYVQINAAQTKKQTKKTRTENRTEFLFSCFSRCHSVMTFLMIYTHKNFINIIMTIIMHSINCVIVLLTLFLIIFFPFFPAMYSEYVYASQCHYYVCPREREKTKIYLYINTHTQPLLHNGTLTVPSRIPTLRSPSFDCSTGFLKTI